MLIATDSFKNSISSEEIAAIFAATFPNVVQAPLADGGEESLEVVSSVIPCEKVVVETEDAYRRPLETYYLLNRKTKTAYVEVAKICGLPSDMVLDVWKTSSYGIGIVLQDAQQQGAETIYLFLGGTGFSDGGMGALVALGFSFLDASGQVLPPVTESLEQVVTVLPPTAQLSVKKIYLVSDVKNRLLGPEGMTYTYALQKGATQGELPALERGTEQYAECLQQLSGRDCTTLASSGAAGGIAFALMNFYPTTVLSGIEYIAKLVELENKIKEANIVVTGEGCIDEQSFYGKTISHVITLCQKYQKPYVLLCGIAKIEHHDELCKGVFQLVDYNTLENESLKEPEKVLRRLLSDQKFQAAVLG